MFHFKSTVMKNLLLILVGFLCTANLFAQTDPQKADTVFYYEWENGGWALTSRSFNTYGEGCQPGSLTYQDLVNGLWINTGKTLYTYDASGRVSAQTEQFWTQFLVNGLWINSIKMLYTYDANSRLSVEIQQNWDTVSSSFENYLRYTFTYNASGNFTFTSTETWDGSAWQPSVRETYTYDGNGYLISLLSEDSLGGSWTNVSLATYTNNSDGKPHIVLDQTSNGSWRQTYTYNGAGKVLTYLDEYWDADSGWTTWQRYTYTYSGNNLTNLLVEYGDNNVEQINHQYTYTYNGDGTVSQYIRQNWDGIWVNNVRGDYVYTTACALPLTLLNFTGTKNNNSVLLTWKTANEINTSHFAVQRSLDAVDYSDIKIVPATPGSVTKTYSFTDNLEGIKAPKIYYRLKMVDKDGKFKMSNVVLVTLANQGLRFSIRPNPAKNYFVITNNASAPSDALVNIIDFSGRSVSKQTITLSGGQKINISALPKGVYMVIINTGDNITTQKLVVQ
jgi:hypothetical protein